MRIGSVLGVMTFGLALGSAAVLAPLVLRSVPSLSGPHSWSEQATGLARSVLAGGAGSREAGSGVAGQRGPAGTGPGFDQIRDAKTANAVIKPAGGTSGKQADARIVQSPWTTQIAVAPEAAAPRKQTSSKPSSEEQRRDLVLDLQRQLKRVGCFEGEADGHWGTASKRAMAAFTDRVNASLPYEQPDFILLTLVQGHAGRACGTSCPAGQGLADNGRCTPTSILAHADRAQADRAKAAEQKPAKADKGEERTAQADEPARPAISSAWATHTVRAASETGALTPLARVASAVPAPVPAVRPPKPETTVAAAEVPASQIPASQVIVRSAPPLPGRMTVGGPMLTPPEPRRAINPARLAAADPAPSAPHAEPVTAVPEPEPQIVRREKKPAAPAARSDERSQPAAPHAKRAPEPVVVHRPPPPPAPRVSYPRSADATSGMSKSRRLVYEMFQRPDRN